MSTLFAENPIGKDPKVDVSLERRRNKFIARVNTWFADGREIWPDVDLNQLDVRTSIVRNLCVCEEDGEMYDEDQCQCRLSPAADDKRPPDIDTILPLPSSLVVLPDGWAQVAKQEEALRVAQARELLQKIRSDIATKSHLYAGNRTMALGKRNKTRAYRKINQIESSMRSSIKQYDLARWALLRLNVLNQYPDLREIVKADTKAVVSVYDPNRPGQRDKGLSWLWKEDMAPGATEKTYVAECEWPFYAYISTI